MYWNLLIWSIVYIVVGRFFMKVTANYIDGLKKEVEAIDKRYLKRLLFEVKVNSEIQKDVYSVLFLAFWPIFCISVVWKAEIEYDSIVRRNVMRKTS